MKKALGVFSAVILGSQVGLAADIFVRDAKGSDLSNQQVSQVTNIVRRSVTNMPEHSLVRSEDQADFVLQPTVVTRGDQMVLRIEKEKDGQVLAMAEEPIQSVEGSGTYATTATETALQDDAFVAQSDEASDTSGGRSIASIDNQSADSSSSSATSQSASDNSSSQSGSSMGAGEVNAPSPRFQNPNRLGYFQIGIGPAFGVNLENDKIMYNINGSYNIDFRENITGKVLADLNIGTGTEEARFLNFGVGADWYPTQQSIAGGRPYVMGDIGYAFTRNSDEAIKDAPAVGVGAGFKFSAAQLNLDANIHYSILTSQIDNDNPQVLGLRLAVNF